MGKLIVSLSPHAHGTDTVERNMYGVIIALMPALLVSFYFFGLGSVIVTATSVAACVCFEWAISKYIMKQERNTICDGSAILTGLLLAFNLPSNLPIWIIILGALFAIGFAKMPFGGLGNNLFNPALVGRAALLVAFPAQMTTWPKVGQLGSYLDAETGATPLSIMKQAIKSGDASVLDQLPDSLSLFIGNHPDGAGAMGEICAVDMPVITAPYPVFLYHVKDILVFLLPEDGRVVYESRKLAGKLLSLVHGHSEPSLLAFQHLQVERVGPVVYPAPRTYHAYPLNGICIIVQYPYCIKAVFFEKSGHFFVGRPPVIVVAL